MSENIPTRLRFFLAGWLNQVFTRLCQSFLKWPLGMTLLCFILQKGLSGIRIKYFGMKTTTWMGGRERRNTKRRKWGASFVLPVGLSVWLWLRELRRRRRRRRRRREEVFWWSSEKVIEGKRFRAWCGFTPVRTDGRTDTWHRENTWCSLLIFQSMNDSIRFEFDSLGCPAPGKNLGLPNNVAT